MLLKGKLYIFWSLHQTTTVSFVYLIQAMLYIFWSLHQTTTCSVASNMSNELYIFWSLHQTTTSYDATMDGNVLYIFWSLHQTTTEECSCFCSHCCISFDPYIKPQLQGLTLHWHMVVYLLIPTSNHNRKKTRCVLNLVVYLLIPTSNHNSLHYGWYSILLYIFWSLHQTTTRNAWSHQKVRCISFDPYIKPQRRQRYHVRLWVVYLLIPTSNHNFWTLFATPLAVVYLLIPTSNHNGMGGTHFFWTLYIFWSLHQTTTNMAKQQKDLSCISFDPYIKPQRRSPFLRTGIVVYLLIPTSNHNLRKTRCVMK